jgi:hypothetical protein
MTFLKWLTANAYRDDGVGEIAKKVIDDSSYPVYMIDIYSVHEQVLKHTGASADDHRLLRRAWIEYSDKHRTEG